MPDRYQPLRDAIAAGPTKGPWLTTAPDEIEGQFFVVTMSRDGDERRIVCKINNFISGRPLEDEDIASAAYIAAADPNTVAALLRERDNLRELVSAITDNRRKCFIPTLGIDTPDALLNWDERARAALADGEAQS